MTQYLPPNLLALFAPRDPIPYLPPPDKLVSEKKRTPYRGLSQYLSYFEDPKDKPPPVKVETKSERMERKQRDRSEMEAYRIEKGIALWNPNNNPEATSDPYKTLFVSRISYDTSEAKLRREFETYGPLKKVCMIKDKAENPRGYAFLEFERERDMHAAYKHADGRKIDGRRVLVDVERGRTVKGWLPRRLGGGLGDTRRARAPGGMPLETDNLSDNANSYRKDRYDGGVGDSERSDRRSDRSASRDRSSRRDRDRYDDYKKHNRENSYRNDRRHDSRSDSTSRDHRHQGFRAR
ncbi:hypothetical protein M514_08778 [Trichuris suis]|uniref:U1 small nuclear ribonucleoprotein 70 kDa n=1 Tax=Trichuris suis TaxID=68888 RepID=A0A085LZK0_9BILA|nr:hypothetical protein M513_08778 [Trichuris suis]KFD59755.1 hypothetical protein M514_08778 [Trichuris suis]